MSELKPCPFCGGEAHIERMGTNRVSMQIECGNCGAEMETGETWIDENSAWNIRAPQSEWIRVEDELPTCDGCFWISFAIGDETNECEGYYFSETKLFDSSDMSFPSVTHWMHKPTPPKGN